MQSHLRPWPVIEKSPHGPYYVATVYFGEEEKAALDLLAETADMVDTEDALQGTLNMALISLMAYQERQTADLSETTTLEVRSAHRDPGDR